MFASEQQTFITGGNVELILYEFKNIQNNQSKCDFTSDTPII